MEILVYVNPADPAKERFFQAISKVPSLSPTFVLEQERFIPLLRNTARWWGAIVYVVSDQDDLDLAISMKAYLSNTRVIMVLSEWVETRVKMGLSLSPSLITKANGDFSDVIAVLEKISTIAQQSCNHGG